MFLSHFECKFGWNCTGSLSKNICMTPHSMLFRTQPEMRRRMWEWCGLKTSSSQTKGRRPSWPNWIMGDVVRMLVSLSLYQPLTNLIIRALASVWGRKGAFSGSTQELEGWAPDSQPKRKLRAQGVAVVVVYNAANVHLQGACVFDLYSL